MAKHFKALQAKMAPEARRRAEAKADAMLRSMSLDELREALELTQEELAARLQVKQPAIAKLERREDVRLSTLRALLASYRPPQSPAVARRNIP
ncbi:MAG: XRE family transcriptional regulator [candidate division NC10 bacterium]|nr:XRE family transcriptional regulator [candidate division NC10 bacterium]